MLPDYDLLWEDHQLEDALSLMMDHVLKGEHIWWSTAWMQHPKEWMRTIYMGKSRLFTAPYNLRSNDYAITLKIEGLTYREAEKIIRDNWMKRLTNHTRQSISEGVGT